jgi:hypothetical protein
VIEPYLFRPLIVLLLRLAEVVCGLVSIIVILNCLSSSSKVGDPLQFSWIFVGKARIPPWCAAAEKYPTRIGY